MPIDFHHRPGVALVAGGTGGIGSAVVRRLVAYRGQVLIGYRHSAADAEALAAELGADGGTVEIVPLDLAEPAQLAAAVQRAHSLGGLHTVVYAAGPQVPMRHLSTVSAEEMAAQLAADPASFFALTQAVLPALRESRGSLVAVTTAATDRYPVRDGLSAGPKAAVEALVRGIAAEEGRFGVRANCVGPGMLTDGMAERLISSGELDDHALAVTRGNIALRRFGTADDVAEAVCFLASDAAGFISGQKLNVDGGYTV